jgi:hypothetical protein
LINISHGDCIGSDTDFHNLCIDYKNTDPIKKIRIDIFPPNNSKFRAFNHGDLLMDEKPYLQRNLDIINNSSILIAYPIDKNKEVLRFGTWNKKKQKLIIYIL